MTFKALSHSRLAPCLALAAAVALSSAGCGGGGDGTDSNVPPTLAFQTPSANFEGQVGTILDIRYVADDPDDEAWTDLYADRDGDVATTHDRYEILRNQPDGGGAARTVSWDTTGVAEGTYFLVGVVRDDVNGARIRTCAATVAIWEIYPHDHSNIVLRDVYGDPITAGSDHPYSPRETCGACHDVDEMSNGYHFQQGRTDATGAIRVKDDFFADGRTWLKSDGMYGKW